MCGHQAHRWSHTVNHRCRIQNEDFEWTTLADVEGNEFCVVQSEQA